MRKRCTVCCTAVKVTSCRRCGGAVEFCPQCDPRKLCLDCLKASGGGWYSPAEAAAYLHAIGTTSGIVSTKTIYNWVHSGQLQAERWGDGHGKGIHITRRTLDEFTPPTPGGTAGRPAITED